MAKAELRTHIGLRVWDPEYWDLLERSLNQAKALLWRRLQHGLYRDDEEAKAVMDAYWALRKVIKLQEELVRQVPLPERVAEDYPPARIGLQPQEVANDRTSQP